MSSVEILIVIFSAFIVLLIIVFVRSSMNKRVKEVFDKVALALGAQVGRSSFGTPRVEGHYQDVGFRVLYEHGMQNSPAVLRVRILKAPGFALGFRREGLDTKLSKRIGLMKDLKIGVPDFDDEFFIETSDRTRCLAYLSGSENRDSIRRIYGLGWRARFDKDWLELSKSLRPTKGLTFDPTSLLEREKIVDLVQEGALLSRGY